MTRTYLACVAVLVAIGAGTAACREAPGVRREIEIRELRFHPAEIIVGLGDTVTWINRDIVPHTATADGTTWDSANLAPEGRFDWIARERGTFRYTCRYHPDMTGQVMVQ